MKVTVVDKTGDISARPSGRRATTRGRCGTIPDLWPALPAGPDLRFDTLNRRALPGTGELPLGEFLTVCTQCGLQGVLSVELVNEGLRTLDLPTYVPAIHRAATSVIAATQTPRY